MSKVENAIAVYVPPFLQKKAERIDGGRFVVVLEEKHGTWYYDPRDWGGYFNLCHHIFTERLEIGHWYSKDPPKEPVKPDKIPEGITDPEVVAFYQRRDRLHLRDLREYREAKDAWELQNKAITQKWAAAEFLESRSDCEYESFRVVDLQTPREKLPAKKPKSTKLPLP